MSTETIIKVGGITQGTKELSIKQKEFAIGGEDWIEGAGSGISRVVPSL
jgi:hypothetical protein